MTSMVTTTIAAWLLVLSSAGVGKPALSLGFASIQTVKAASRPGGQHSMYPGVIVRVASEHGSNESFILSNEVGVAKMPLRPGSYCFDVYTRKGEPLPLDPEQPACFTIAAGKTTDVGVVIRGK